MEGFFVLRRYQIKFEYRMVYIYVLEVILIDKPI
jgi:hypothetical protein